MKPMVDYAIWYHQQGIGVIPCNGKQALIEWKQYEERRPYENEILEWWTQWPDANIAIITGRVSGIVALDADGPDADEALKDKHLPPTPVSGTGKGFHYIFKHPGVPVKNWSRKRPGLDFRGDGGYIIAPPSLHSSGIRYEWKVKLTEKEDCAELPDWILRLCGAKPNTVIVTNDVPEWYEQAFSGTTEGDRNTTATKLAGRYLGMGLSAKETLAFLRVWNKRNNPPLPDADIERVVGSIHQAERNKRTTDALIGGREVDLNKLSDDEQRDVILAALTQALGGIKIHRLLKYMSEQPVYHLETSTGNIELGDVSYLSNQKKFGDRILATENRVLSTFKPHAWKVILQKLVDIREEIEVSEEATPQGQLKGWLEAYLTELPAYPDIESAKATGRAFTKDNGTYIFLSNLLRFVVTRSMERNITEKDLAVRLRSIGARTGTIKTGGKVFRAWKLPEENEEVFESGVTQA